MSIAVVAGFLALSLASVVTSSQPKPEGYLAEPKSGHGPGVLVLHAWWGLNADVKALCDRLTHSGYVAFAPDLFDGKIATTRSEAEALVNAYNPKEAELKAKIRDSAKFLAEKSGKKEIAVVGLSFGAYYALEYSNDEPERAKAVVVFYGTGPEDFKKSKAAFLGHFAENDEFEPKPGVDGLEKTLRDGGHPTTFYSYPGVGHWFFEPSVKAAYSKPASDLAWERTLEFLQKNLPTKTD